MICVLLSHDCVIFISIHIYCKIVLVFPIVVVTADITDHNTIKFFKLHIGNAPNSEVKNFLEHSLFLI